MNLLQLETELSDRGFTTLTSARRRSIVVDAVQEFDEWALWPWRENSGEGVAPVEVPDLGIIEACTNETQDYPLAPREYRWLLNAYSDLAVAGAPMYYYVAWPDDVPVISTYPTNDDTIGVQYWKQPTALSLDGDVPMAPSRYHSLYALIAQRMCESERGNLQAAQGLQAEIDRQLMRIADSVLGGQTTQGPSDFLEITSSDDA